MHRWRGGGGIGVGRVRRRGVLNRETCYPTRYGRPIAPSEGHPINFKNMQQKRLLLNKQKHFLKIMFFTCYFLVYTYREPRV